MLVYYMLHTSHVQSNLYTTKIPRKPPLKLSMPQRCVVAGCSNTTKEGVSLHLFPKDINLRRKWTSKVKLTRAHWKGPSDRSVVCSEHFCAEDFTDSTGLHSAFGIKKRPSLKQHAIPNIKLGTSTAGPAPGSSTESKRTGSERPAFAKRKKARMLDELLLGSDPDFESKDESVSHAAGISESDETPGCSYWAEENPHEHDELSVGRSEEEMETCSPEHAILEPAILEHPTPQQCTRSPEHAILEPAILEHPTPQQCTRSVGTQFSPATRVKRIQASVLTRETGSWKRAEVTSTGTQCQIEEEMRKTEEKKTETVEEKEEKENSSDENTNSSSDPPKKRESSPGYSPDTSPSSKEQSTPQKPLKKRKKSRGQRPSTSWQPGSSVLPHLDNKYLVFETQLMELFQRCSSCGSASVGIQKWTKGTLVVISQECWSCSASKSTWASQPWYGSTPAGNVLLSAATLFAGGSCSKMLQIMDNLKLACFVEQTFYRHQKHILQPAIEHQWNIQQDALHSQLVTSGTPLTIGGDGRADSPGHSAKYGMYTAIELDGNKIIDIQLVQSNEVKSSYHMELEGFKRMFRNIQSKGLTIQKLVTDRHRQLAKYVRETTPNVIHMYDVWHVAKAVRKKVHSLAKQKNCEVVGEWEQSINNHVYWVASSTKDNEEEMRVAKWSSLENHIQGIHSGHSELFPRCLHGDLEGNSRKKWLKPSTMACEKLGSIITSTLLVKDIRKLSSGKQTSSLESFHSLVNQFAPKMKAYSYFGITSRIHLAGLHYNENSDREQATTSTGEKRYKISKPKFKPGSATVKAVKEDAQYTYIANLMEEVAERSKTYKPGPRRKAAPPTLCSRHSYPSKDQLIQQHRSRFNVDS